MYNIDKGRQRKDMEKLNCVTCNHSLRDTCKITADFKYAYCTICQTKYRILPAKDNSGNPISDAEGREQYYLDPIVFYDTSNKYMSPSSASVCSSEVLQDYDDILYELTWCKSVNQFLAFLDKK